MKEVINQVSHSKKWQRLSTDNGWVNSYSLLQDKFFEHMYAAGFPDIERGERGSTRKHLTDMEYKTMKESERLAAKNEQIAAADAELATTKEQLATTKKSLKTVQGKVLSVKQIEQIPVKVSRPKPKAQQRTNNREVRQLGNIMYEVSINFKQGATETLDQKIIRIIKNELGVV